MNFLTNPLYWAAAIYIVVALFIIRVDNLNDQRKKERSKG